MFVYSKLSTTGNPTLAVILILLYFLGDENRPQCGNCTERNVACEFKEWTFVSRVSSSHRKSEKVQEQSMENTASQVSSFLISRSLAVI